MPDTAPDYTWYTKEFMGDLNEEAFNANVVEAARLTNYVIGFNEVNESNINEYRNAVCMATEDLATYGAEGREGMSIGSFSVQSGTRSGRDIAIERIERALVGSGLLFQGVA